jgi:hypothetical protein
MYAMSVTVSSVAAFHSQIIATATTRTVLSIAVLAESDHGHNIYRKL